MNLNESRKTIYNNIIDAFESKGLDFDEFYNNPSYFEKDNEGNPIALQGSHPSLLHWPLANYEGGGELLSSLLREKQVLDDVAGPDAITWVDSKHWHSTVFSPVHSSDPKLIEKVNTDMADTVRAELEVTAPYSITFTRIVITTGVGIKAVGYASNDQVDSLRERLKRAVPHGHASPLIHISLGNICNPLHAHRVERLKNYVRPFKEDQSILGTIKVTFLTYSMYSAPFIHMSVKKIFSQALNASSHE